MLTTVFIILGKEVVDFKSDSLCLCSLEKANALLLDELQQKELEYNTLQEDVRDLNGRLVKFRDEHSKELSKLMLG